MADAAEQDESAKDPEPKPDLGDGGKKALDAERKARRDAEKKTTELEARLREIEDKDKPEITRLTEENAQLKSQLASRTSETARYKVALDKKLTATQAKRLVGDTEEELAADADELLADLGATPKADETKSDDQDKSLPGKPVEDLKSGSGVETSQEDTDDVSAIGARMFAR